MRRYSHTLSNIYLPSASECLKHIGPRLAGPQPEQLGERLPGLRGLREVAPVERPLVTRDAAQRLGELELQDGAGEVPAEAERGWRSKTSNERTFLRGRFRELKKKLQTKKCCSPVGFDNS